MIDSHCHLDACGQPFGDHPAQPVADLVARAREAGVDRILAIGTDAGSCLHALGAADDHDEVHVSVGRHPHEAEGFDGSGLAELERLAAHPKARAIGETGLDYKRDRSPRAAQRRAFVAQIELARALGRPLVVHTREAAGDTLDLLARHAQGLDVIIHCFSLSGRLDECIERGYHCSFAGNVTYPKAKDLQRAAQRVPDRLLLVETDAPFLAPQQRRGRPNEPACVRATAAFVAELRGVSYERLDEIVAANSERLFGW